MRSAGLDSPCVPRRGRGKAAVSRERNVATTLSTGPEVSSLADADASTRPRLPGQRIGLDFLDPKGVDGLDRLGAELFVRGREVVEGLCHGPGARDDG